MQITLFKPHPGQKKVISDFADSPSEDRDWETISVPKNTR